MESNTENMASMGVENESANTIGASDGSNETNSLSKMLDPYADTEKISAKIDKVLELDRFERALFEKEWFRNVLFFIGQQWVIWDTGRWRQKRLPAWYPRVITNKFAEKVNEFISQLMQGRTPIRYVPSTDDAEDMATAEIGESARQVFYEEAGIDSLETTIASWFVICGNVFLIPYYDTDDKYGMKSVPGSQCVDCGEMYTSTQINTSEGACPNCGSTNLAPTDDESVQESFPVGALQVEVASPFEIRLDQRISDIAQHRRFVRLKRMDVALAKEKWPDFADEIKADTGIDLGQHYLDSLAHVTASYGGSEVGRGVVEGVSNRNPKTTLFYYYELPSDDFPDGLEVIRAGRSSDAIVSAGPLKTTYGAGARKGQPFMPLIHIGFEKAPGRFWYKTRMDDVVSLQLWRNTIESALRLTTQRMANGVWLVPKGSGVDNITGEPGQVLEYNPLAVGGTVGVKPERLPADLSGVQALVGLMNKIDDSIERVTGTFFLQGGDAPPGVTAASALAYLGERGQRALAPIMRSWAKGWKHFEQMALEIVRQNWDDERLITVAGKNRQWEVKKFSSAELTGSVEFHIDYENIFPKNQAADRAAIAELVNMKVINPTDPEQGYKILEKYGMTNIRASFDIDVMEARKENEMFMDSAQTGDPIMPKVVPLVQNSQVHMIAHTDLAKTDEFKALPEQIQAMWLQHIHDTMADIIGMQQMQAGIAASVGQAGGAPPPGAQPQATAPPQHGAAKMGAVPAQLSKGATVGHGAPAQMPGAAAGAVHVPNPGGGGGPAAAPRIAAPPKGLA